MTGDPSGTPRCRTSTEKAGAMLKASVRKTRLAHFNGMWMFEHRFCVGIKDTVVYCKSQEEAISVLDRHSRWHLDRLSYGEGGT